MKAYKIKDDIVAAHNEEQALETWAAHFGEDPKAAGPCEEIDPATYMVSYEQDDGSYKDGPLSDAMPTDNPEIVCTADD